MPPRQALTVTVRDQTYTFTPQLVDDFPELVPFLTYLLDADRVQSHIAETYVKLVARLRRQGRLADVDLIHHRNERTAANAFLKWQRETYALRVREVARAFSQHNNIAPRVRFVRRHSLVPPFAGKQIPVAVMPAPVEGSLAERFPLPPPGSQPRLKVVEANTETAQTVTWGPCDKWTLHVPPRLMAPHVDPCPTCLAIELDAAQLASIADVFEKAWGHRDLNLVPHEAYLFGAPPADSDITEKTLRGEKAVALVRNGCVRADVLGKDGVSVVGALDHFIERLNDGVDGVYISREACGEKLGDVLGALWRVWGGAGPAA
jgi:hypothetical protein